VETGTIEMVTIEGKTIETATMTDTVGIEESLRKLDIRIASTVVATTTTTITTTTIIIITTTTRITIEVIINDLTRSESEKTVMMPLLEERRCAKRPKVRILLQ
jgi:hypothetical protein